MELNLKTTNFKLQTDVNPLCKRKSNINQPQLKATQLGAKYCEKYKKLKALKWNSSKWKQNNRSEQHWQKQKTAQSKTWKTTPRFFPSKKLPLRVVFLFQRRGGKTNNTTRHISCIGSLYKRNNEVNRRRW